MKVSVIIVNYNGHKDTIECLQSLLFLKEDFEIVIVDNSADDGSCNTIRRWLNKTHHINTIPEVSTLQKSLKSSVSHNFVSEESMFDELVDDHNVTIIRSIKNNGFAAANNVGIKFLQRYRSYDWIWLLNNDTVVKNDILACFANLVSVLPRDVGIIGSVLMEYHKPNLIQSVGGYYNSLLGYISNVDTGMSIDYSKQESSSRVSYPVGASIFVKKEFLSNVGLMNERYFLYYEELDWVIRAKRKGWKFATSYDCKVWHKGGGSINNEEKKSKLNDYFLIRSKLLFTYTYYPVFLPTIYLGIFATVLNRIRRHQWDRVADIIKICLFPSISIERTLAFAKKQRI